MQLISIQKAAQRMGVSRSTVERMLARGDIAGYQFPSGTVRIDPLALDAFIKSCQTVASSTPYLNNGQAEG